ncbi:tRNA synthetases class I (C) catalytic domain-containing protein [Russula earlei]|uniref:tRNA synthetases class I (C) catalytic domain-containing protein n=1 Tax=Russula earlei TaxID=71964 RepID=A0ACC0U9E5_9AGAM|nr:tRNA synthetases class I (C) catalytic domain-containing protein [Russula earlei]
MSHCQTDWKPPSRRSPEPVLKVYNSFTRTKDEFIPRHGRRIKWYNCGPTVYDAAHMGHARNYVTQDILRRIMSDYFGYDIRFVMNITDIDDKIILRARQTHLVNKFRSTVTSLTQELLDEVRSSWCSYVRSKVSKGLPLEDVSPAGLEWRSWSDLSTKAADKAWKDDAIKRDEKFEMHFVTARRAYGAIQAASNHLKAGKVDIEAAQQLVNDSADVLALSLDEKALRLAYFYNGASVTDPSLSRSLARFWEAAFFEDMARLRVKQPDTLTRVTEYVPEIVAFVERIMQNGYAYEVAGSVYFDTNKFDSTEGHRYAKLEPWSKGNMELLEEGEGALSKHTGRRSTADFALWKASKPGEPSWSSPWGQGRPGWHIECSVMASAILGDNMDIHSGGIDLAFPHHDNEVAQAEAYHECSAWVNYFLHTGHLHIEGLKMSKSLKNFITIDEILRKHSARQLRLAFLTQLWNSKMDFSESLMAGEVKNVETTMNNFFTVAKALISQTRSEQSGPDGDHRYHGPERALTDELYQAQDRFREALCDSFDTPSAVNVLRELVSRTNVYIKSRGNELDVSVVECVARWIGNMLRMFGLGEGDPSELGWGQLSQDGSTSLNREEVVMPYLRVLSSFRDGVRQLAISKRDGATKDILALCDKVRDSDLVPLGVALDDQEDGKALVKLVDPTELIRVREERRAQAEARAAKKAAAQELERQKKTQKLERGSISPEQLFKPPNVPEGVYSSWDDQGLPLTDGEGKELSKNQTKKVQKDWTAQKKLHEEYLAWKKEVR